MPHNGALEAEAMKARLIATITKANGRVYEGVADDAEIAVGTTGAVKPHLILSFAKPIKKARGRGIGGGEAAQPYIFIATVEAVASDAVTARRMSEDVDVALTGWVPGTTNNAGELSGRNGVNSASINANLRPSRFTLPTHWECEINLRPGPAPTA